MKATIRPTALLPLMALACSLCAAPAALAQKHEDPKYGYEIRIPKDFNVVPINLDEKWVIAKFLYKRALDARRGWEREAPEVRVIVFPKFDPAEFAKRKLEQKGNLLILQQLENPYKNYHEYMQKNYRGSGGGWHVAEERDDKIDGLTALYKRIEVNKIMEGEEGISHIIHAWEIDYGDAVYVVHCQGLADHDSKFRRLFKSTADSFKQVERTESVRAGHEGPTTPRDATTNEEGEPLTPEEIFERRKAALERIREKAIAQLPDHWKHFEKGRFLVVYNGEVDARFLTRVHKQANEVWDWLEEEFGFIGENKAVGGIIRVCNDINEAAAYVDTSGKSAFSARTREIVIWKDRNYGFDECRGRLNQGICQRWLIDKNHRLWNALPPWLDFGLVYYIGALELKGRKLEASVDEWDMEIVRTCLREGSFKDAKSMFEAQYGKNFGSVNDRVQCVAMVNFLMTKGARISKYKDIVSTYLKVLDRRVREHEKASRKSLEKTAEEGGDEEDFENWFEEWQRKREAIFNECLKECFGDWSEKDWEQFETYWRRSFKG